MTTIVHDPGNSQKIETLYAFLSRDENGNEGIIAQSLPGLGTVTFVTGEVKNLESLKTVAKSLKEITGKKIVLVKYSNQETIEEL